MSIVSVLKVSKEFPLKHAQWLHKGHLSVRLTDAGAILGANAAPLLYRWPEWRSKLERFNPEISPLFELDKMTLRSDFGSANPHEAPRASSLMFIPTPAKSAAGIGTPKR
ncbi:hypothetical protein [Klebsiella aerogenes]|uniref:hypothetical protein n=1 Tax=Klebsiella aerogenes TaxID=548 RepID=UPI0009B84D35|nr:hypothetical protein [Klebsiella aerogenes]